MEDWALPQSKPAHAPMVAMSSKLQSRQIDPDGSGSTGACRRRHSHGAQNTSLLTMVFDGTVVAIFQEPK
jgi:hypothetical protein